MGFFDSVVDVLKDVGEVVSGPISAISSAYGAYAANEANFESQRRAQSFTQDMYRNRYKWQMQDMRRAGLNPILSGSLGAPGTAGGVGAGAMRNVGEAASQGIQSALAVRQNKAAVNNMQQDLKNKREEQVFIKNRALRENAEYWKAHWQSENERVLGDVYEAQATGARALEEMYSKYPVLRMIGAAGGDVLPWVAAGGAAALGIGASAKAAKRKLGPRRRRPGRVTSSPLAPLSAPPRAYKNWKRKGK